MLFSCEGNRERCQEDVILRGLNVSMKTGFGLHVPRTTVGINFTPNGKHHARFPFGVFHFWKNTTNRLINRDLWN